MHYTNRFFFHAEIVILKKNDTGDRNKRKWLPGRTVASMVLEGRESVSKLSEYGAAGSICLAPVLTLGFWHQLQLFNLSIQSLNIPVQVQLLNMSTIPGGCINTMTELEFPTCFPLPKNPCEQFSTHSNVFPSAKQPR